MTHNTDTESKKRHTMCKSHITPELTTVIAFVSLLKMDVIVGSTWLSIVFLLHQRTRISMLFFGFIILAANIRYKRKAQHVGWV